MLFRFGCVWVILKIGKLVFCNDCWILIKVLFWGVIIRFKELFWVVLIIIFWIIGRGVSNVLVFFVFLVGENFLMCKVMWLFFIWFLSFEGVLVVIIIFLLIIVIWFVKVFIFLR